MTTTWPSAPTDASETVRTALEALDAAAVVYCLRNGPAGLVPLPGADVDVLVAPAARRAAGLVLARSGWYRLNAPGHWGHQFWLRPLHDGQWIKIDLVWRLRYGDIAEATPAWLARRVSRDGAWVASPSDEERHREHRAAGRRERPGNIERAIRRIPPRPRRGGPVVAVLGPDGAGKGLVVDALSSRLPVAVTTGYLGVGGRSHASRGPTPAATHRETPPETRQRVVRVREVAFLTRKWLRTLPTFYRAYRAAWKGHVVVLDRHPLDAVAVRPQRSRWGAQLERILATRLSPRPDAVLVLDAPGTVLFARKGEHSPSVLERWRQGYRALTGDDVHLLDATRKPEEVFADASRIVWGELARRRRWDT